MFRHILVPLDGLLLAERAIEYAQRLAYPSRHHAMQGGTTVHLVLGGNAKRAPANPGGNAWHDLGALGD